MTDPRDECEIFQRLDGGTMASSPQGPTSPLATRSAANRSTLDRECRAVLDSVGSQWRAVTHDFPK